MSQPSFFVELQRRHVYKVGVAYGVAGWLLVQVATQVFPFFEVSNSAVRWVVIAVIAGFPVALALSWVFDITPQGIVRTDALAAGDAALQAAQRRSMDRRLNYVLGALLVAAGAYIAADRAGVLGPGARGGGSDKSIAVLPFENLSDDKTNAYFAEGIQDEILTRLAQIGALRVISRTSTQHFASSPDNLPEIARQLGVANILEGSVQKSGDAVHVNVQLIHAATDDHLWAQTYDRKLDNIFSVESEVAGAIAQALKAQLSGSERQALAKLPTRSAEAYDAYLRGVALSTDYDESRGYFLSLIDLFTKAVTADPDFAEAWAYLSNARTQYYFEHEHTPQQLASAKAAADAALRLQPDLPEAWLALGYYRYWGEEDYDGALEAYEHARRQTPNSAFVMELIGLVKRRQGKWEESLADLRQAAQLDPHNSEIWINIGFSQEALRRFDQAREAYGHGLEAQPGNETIIASQARSYLAQGNTEAAAAALAGIRLDPSQSRVAQAFSKLWRQQRTYAQGIAEWSKVIDAGGTLPPAEAAFAHLNRAGLEACAGQREAARADLAFVRERLESLRAAGDSGAFILLVLGPVDAALGDRAAALQMAAQGQAQVARDAFARPDATIDLALVQMYGGDAAAAVAALQSSLAEPGGITAAELKQDCRWDPLRTAPGFASLVAAEAAATKP
ncbi:MAG: tetratricopeptide repeat protein [Nevskia sp.]|nr:tetratricopeptide repeat protein [Nevskia sp.]